MRAILGALAAAVVATLLAGRALAGPDFVAGDRMLVLVIASIAIQRGHGLLGLAGGWLGRPGISFQHLLGLVFARK